MFEEEKVAFFLATRSIIRGNKGTLALTIMIIAMVFVNLVFQPSIISGVVVLFNRQSIDYSYGNLVIEPKSDRLYIDNVDELQKRIDRVPGVVGTSPRYAAGATYVNKGKSLSRTLYAINPDDEKSVLKISSSVVSGDYLSDGDTSQIVLGALLAGNKDEKKDRLPSLGGVDVGDAISITFTNGVTKEYRVKGIVKSDAFAVDTNAFITKKELESVLGIRNRASQILVRTKETGNEDAMRNSLMAYGVQEKIWTWEDKAAGFLEDTVRSFDIINLIATVVSLVIAVVVIFIVIFINTVYRRKQIGILQAIGIDRSIIIKSYIFQALFIFLCGTILGSVLLSFLISYMTAYPLKFPGGPVVPVVEPFLVIRGIISLFAVSVFAGYLPSWITTKEEILSAIRG
jgi:putative ABC transport system permease protein